MRIHVNISVNHNRIFDVVNNTKKSAIMVMMPIAKTTKIIGFEPSIQTSGYQIRPQVLKKSVTGPKFTYIYLYKSMQVKPYRTGTYQKTIYSRVYVMVVALHLRFV